MILFLYVFASIFLIAWVLYPLRGSAQSSSAKDPLLQERITSIESSLKQLYEEGETKISPEDFKNIERQLQISLAKLYQRTGVEPDALAQSKVPQVEANPPEETPTVSEHAFCSQCGASLKSQFTFCPSCGNAVKAAS